MMKLTEEFVSCRTAAYTDSEKIDVGGGFYVVDKTPPGSGEWLDWRMYKTERDEKEDYCASLDVLVYAEWNNLPTIHEIKVNSKYRGMGLGEKLVRAFIDKHGVLASDPEGNTNEAAAHMWERMGAQKVMADPLLNPKGYFYILRK
jgi:ribosomal protein S18 acetylase RimI-like enzyme